MNHILRTPGRILLAALILLGFTMQDATSQADIVEKKPLLDRVPDMTYPLNEGEEREARSATIEELVPDAWDVQHRQLQNRDADVNPTQPMTPEDQEKLDAKLTYRTWLSTLGILPDEESTEQPEGLLFDENGNLFEDWEANLTTMENSPSPPTGNMAVTPKVGVEGQSTYGATVSTVPDGACAVSGAGKLVVANNTHIEIYDEEGNLLSSMAEATFWSPNGPTGNIYDPRVEYDTANNRFIIVELHGNSSNLTEIYFAVSKTSDPMGAWWFYDFTANTGDPTLWFDYPQMAYSNQTLTVAGNMFTNVSGTGSVESKVWIYELDDAYNGANVSSWYFDDVEIDGNNTGSIVPCSYPFGSYGPGLYLISKQNTDFLVYYDITANAGDGPVLNSYLMESPIDLTAPLNCPQSGTTGTLQNASRMQSAYADPSGSDDFIHYSLAYSDGSGDGRILLGRLNVADEEIVNKTYGASGWDYAFPTIQPWATSSGSWDGGSLVGFLRVSSTSFPEFRVAHGYPHVSDWSPGSVSVKFGETPISVTTRWGDYIGSGYREGQSDPECWVYGQYGLNNDHGLWYAQVSLNIEGCTDDDACNYDSGANVDDGSCDYEECSGCMDDSACNYDNVATIEDGSCTYPGCNDWGACNFNSAAGCNDGSCCYNICVELDMDEPVIGLQLELLWYELKDNGSGSIIYSGNNLFGTNPAKFCLEDGCYTLLLSGDEETDWSLNWDPWIFILGMDLNIAAGTGPGTIDFIVGDGGESAGCTDAEACNYNPEATCDNGTCCMDNCLTVNMTDTYGDGWNNSHWEIYHADELVSTGTLEDGSLGTDIACLPAGCYLFKVNTLEGSYTWEIGWELYGADEEGLSGGAGTEVYFTIDGGGEDAGCTDEAACNYDPEAICDDESCCYENCGQLIMSDTYGDGWNGATMTIVDGNGSSETYTLADGVVGYEDLCFADGCYDVSVTGGTWPDEVSWQLVFDNYLIGGGANFSNTLNLAVVMGCMDETACNFNPLATCSEDCCEYESCIETVTGCTYANATNFVPAATEDDGSCLFDDTGSTACATDVNGDGTVTILDLLEVLGDFGNECDPDANE